MVGMDRASANRRDRFVEFTGLVHAIGMHSNLDIVGVRYTERLVNNTRIAGVILVHLQTTGAGLNLADERLRRGAGGTAEDAQIHALVLEGEEHVLQVKPTVSLDVISLVASS